MTDDANNLKDLKLALRLLHGSLLPDDSEDEARSALARLLRNLREPVDSAVRLVLAALFDPKLETYFSLGRETIRGRSSACVKRPVRLVRLVLP